MSLTAFIMAACAKQPPREPDPKSGTASISAAAMGSPVSAIVELEDMYRAPETYDVRITVLEILRGEPSMDLVIEANASNAPAQNGFEYALARIKFEYAARGAPGNKTWELAGKQFSAFSGDGKPYESPSIVLPEPSLDGKLRSGDTRQGWIAFAVAKDDKKPVMTFSPGGIWFRLY
jgi:hypothetical protein